MPAFCKVVQKAVFKVAVIIFTFFSTAHVFAQSAGDPIVQLQSGGQFNCVRSQKGMIQCWGANNVGQLGRGNITPVGAMPGTMALLKPIDLGTNFYAIGMAVGSAHACALLNDHTVKCWGGNNQGQLGLGDTLNRGDNPGEMGDALPRVAFRRDQEVVSIVANGGNHTCALFATGQATCWGNNTTAQLGLGIDLSLIGNIPANIPVANAELDLGMGKRIQNMIAGPAMSCAIFTDRTFKCWGLNTSGQLALGDLINRGRQSQDMGDQLPFPQTANGNSPIRSIALGSTHVCALFENGKVKCWGSNLAAQLGVGDMENRGGTPTTTGDAIPWVNVAFGLGVTQISAGTNHTCALLQNSTVKCWGDNGIGQLGQGDVIRRGDTPESMGDSLLPIRLGKNAKVLQLTSGIFHNCALLSDRSVKCWGFNGSGQLGIETNVGLIGAQARDMGDALQKVKF